MTITIHLSPEVEARLREKATREGQDAETTAYGVLAEALEWEAQDRAEAIAGIQRGLEDVAAGRERPLADFLADQRRKYGFAESWPAE